MIEPNVDHFESNFTKICKQLESFYCLFSVIDQLEITNDQKKMGLNFFSVGKLKISLAKRRR